MSEGVLRITEYLDADLILEQWRCNRCGHGLGPLTENYKHGCRLYNRNPQSIYPPRVAGAYTFAPDPTWIRIVEFYCPGCGTMVENELLPPGHPITHDIRLDLAGLKGQTSEE